MVDDREGIVLTIAAIPSFLMNPENFGYYQLTEYCRTKH